MRTLYWLSRHGFGTHFENELIVLSVCEPGDFLAEDGRPITM